MAAKWASCSFLSIKGFGYLVSRGMQTMAKVETKPRVFKMASKCKAGRNKLRVVKPSPKKLAIGSKVKNVFENNSMVAFLQYGDYTTEELDNLRFELSKKDIFLKIFPNRITHKELEKTIYKNMAPLFSSTTCVMYSKDPMVKAVIDIVKKQPKLELLGAKVENRLLSKSKTEEYAKLASLKELHCELSQMLQKPASTLSYLLKQNQQNLVGNLSQFVKQKQEG